MESIKTATGKAFNVNHCGSVNSTLYITFIDSSFIELSSVFSNEDETKHIEHFDDYGKFIESYDDFTQLLNLLYRDNNHIRVTLFNAAIE